MIVAVPLTLLYLIFQQRRAPATGWTGRCTGPFRPAGHEADVTHSAAVRHLG